VVTCRRRRAAEAASRERVFRELLARQEHARASAYKRRIRAWRYYLLVALAFLAVAVLTGFWVLIVEFWVAGLAAMLTWEKAGRNQLEANFDLCSIVDGDEI
jgi:Flp pilus assembly protein TadB